MPTPSSWPSVKVNTGVLVANGGQLRSWLSRLDNKNAQGEFYLTDVIAHGPVGTTAGYRRQSTRQRHGSGRANNRVQLAALERSYQQMQAEKLMIAGATLIDPARFDLRGTLEIGEEVVIDVNVIIEGKVVLGNHVRIGAGSVLKRLRDRRPHRGETLPVIEGAQIADQCSVGPFTRLRPGAVLEQDAHVGNFVEMKKARLGWARSAVILTYIGDATIGAKNIGAGTITCNYDGRTSSRPSSRTMFSSARYPAGGAGADRQGATLRRVPPSPGCGGKRAGDHPGAPAPHSELAPVRSRRSDARSMKCKPAPEGAGFAYG